VVVVVTAEEIGRAAVFADLEPGVCPAAEGGLALK
jgi:hypothetical protein